MKTTTLCVLLPTLGSYLFYFVQAEGAENPERDGNIFNWWGHNDQTDSYQVGAYMIGFFFFFFFDGKKCTMGLGEKPNFS